MRELTRDQEFGSRLIAGIEAATDRPAYDDKDAFEMVLREQGDVRYLCIINPSIDDASASTVHVKGEFAAVVDLDYEHGYPVPARRQNGETTFPLRLEPGEATMIRLEP